MRQCIKGQTIEYYTMMALEIGFTQACTISTHLTKVHGLSIATERISSALQRLKRAGLVEYDGDMWGLKEDQ